MSTQWVWTGLVLALGAGASGAQTGGGTEPVLPRVTVTGSRLPVSEHAPTSPVQIVTSEDLQRTGVTSLRQLLDDLPAASGSLSDTAGMATFAPGASAWSMRGLGPQGTLILLNGRRIAPYGLANYAEVFTNIDALPFQAIERLEIMKIGGAALYGSDAVAGVVNIITRHDVQGWEVRASKEQSLDTGRFDRTTVSLTGGGSVDVGRPTRFVASIGYEKREEVMWGDVIASTRDRYAPLSANFAALSSYSWPGNVIGAGAVSACDPALMRGPYCYYDRTTRTQAVPGAERLQLLWSSDTSLANGQTLFSELTYAHNRTAYAAPSQPYGTGLGVLRWGDPTTGAQRSFWYRGLPAGHPLNPLGVDDAQFRYRFIDGPNETVARSDEYRALMGLRGEWGTRSWETAAGVTGNRARADYRGWWSDSGFHQVIGNDDPTQVDPDFFNRAYQPGQPNTAAVLDTLFPHYGYRGEARQYFIDGTLTGPLGRGPAGPIDSVMGFDLRHERFVVDPDQRLRSGDIVGNGVSASDGARNVIAAFGELSIPMTQRLALQAAARWDKYQGTGSRMSPKVGMRYIAAPALTLRATAETGFRAPNLTESAASTKFAYYQGIADPQRCPQAQALAGDLAQAAGALPASDPQRAMMLARANGILQNECASSVASTMYQNPALKPETSQSFSFGFVLAPDRRWRITMDRWAILRRNEIGYRDLTELLDGEASLAPGTIRREDLVNDRSFNATEQSQYGVSQGALRSVDSRFENVSRTRTSGTDIGTQAYVNTGMGRVELGLDATYLHEVRSQVDSSGRWGDNLAGRSGFPRWKGVGTVSLVTTTFTHTLRAVTRSGTSLQGDYYDTLYSPEGCTAQGYTASQCRVGGYTRWDYALEYRASAQVRMALNLRNVFGRQVPVGIATWRNSGGLVPPTDEDARGRMLRLALEWRPR